MKNRIIIAIAILLSIPASVLAQTVLEKAVLKELNHYRDSLGLHPVIYSANVSKAASHHTQWMSKVNFDKIKKMMEVDDGSEAMDAHLETIDIPDFKELKTPEDRGNFYRVTNDISSQWEICNITSANGGNYFVRTQTPDSMLAKNIINKFLNSPGHKLLMGINAAGAYVGIGVIVKDVVINGQSYKIAYTTIYFIEK
jgi:hypothetical protein